jgi:hypothetical protein
MPSVVQQWKDWYSGAYDPPQYIAGYGNFWLNTVTKGVWEKISASAWVLRGYLGASINNVAGVVFVTFDAQDWVSNRITIIPLGIPVHGEVGPHMIPPRLIMSSIMELNGALSREIGCNVIFDYTTGRYNIYKAGLTKPFDGVAELRFAI